MDLFLTASAILKNKRMIADDLPRQQEIQNEHLDVRNLPFDCMSDKTHNYLFPAYYRIVNTYNMPKLLPNSHDRFYQQITLHG